MQRYVLLAIVSVSSIGCDSGLKTHPTAKSSGTVICDGKPVGNVRITFGPIASKGVEAGKVGLAVADDQGEFVLTTYTKNDGAVVGKHNVMVLPPVPEDFPKFTCKCETDARKVVTQVEVKSGGDNRFIIELPPKTKQSAPNYTPKQLREMKEEAQADKAAAEQVERVAAQDRRGK